MRLYIVMREDLWDLNPGKAMAQAAHAQAMFDAYIAQYANELYEQEVDHDPALINSVHDWRADRGFGITTVLTAPLGDFGTITMGVEHYGYVDDPTYPYRNYYKQLFTRKEITCLWVYAMTEKELEHMKQYKLHP